MDSSLASSTVQSRKVLVSLRKNQRHSMDISSKKMISTLCFINFYLFTNHQGLNCFINKCTATKAMTINLKWDVRMLVEVFRSHLKPSGRTLNRTSSGNLIDNNGLINKQLSSIIKKSFKAVRSPASVFATSNKARFHRYRKEDP